MTEDERPPNAIDVLIMIQRTQLEIMGMIADVVRYLDDLKRQMGELAGTEGSYTYLKPIDTAWHVHNYLRLKGQMKITQAKYVEMYRKEGITVAALQRELSRQRAKTRQKPDKLSD